MDSGGRRALRTVAGEHAFFTALIEGIEQCLACDKHRAEMVIARNQADPIAAPRGQPSSEPFQVRCADVDYAAGSMC